MRNTDNPLIKIYYPDGTIVEMYKHEAITAGLVQDDDKRKIETKEIVPAEIKVKKTSRKKK